MSRLVLQRVELPAGGYEMNDLYDITNDSRVSMTMNNVYDQAGTCIHASTSLLAGVQLQHDTE